MISSPGMLTTPARNGCLRTPEAYILARGVTTIPYHTHISICICMCYYGTLYTGSAVTPSQITRASEAR
eukprot:2941766-Pleurochrysis_carterae.AAC.1